jgi:hypothetical protein
MCFSASGDYAARPKAQEALEGGTASQAQSAPPELMQLPVEMVSACIRRCMPGADPATVNRNLESVRNTQGELMLRLQVHSGHDRAGHLSHAKVNRQLR